MDFPDRNNFLQLQKHFSHRPSLQPAVMVGAGMSLNANPLSNASSPLPNWAELSRAMFEEIYPEINSGSDKQKRELEIKFNRSNALRIASEYEAQFKRGKLNEFLLQSIPDEDHEPGIIHRLLLSLPWKDVFTTNYDRLLERTDLTERSFQTVKSVKDLAIAQSPRIIKLHGSFPTDEPFIITEDDYRTYPKRFAPFVNTVLQSLIETPLVLVGFSGDDPNFLEWLGWIRDELGEYHSLIYLAGLLSLTNVDRALLARRGITPIDLSPVSRYTTSDGNRHAATLEWFLRSLQNMESPRPERWPDL